MNYLEPHYHVYPVACCLIGDVDGETAAPEVWAAFLEYCYCTTDEGRAYDAALRGQPWIVAAAQQLALIEP